jgi:hypothetical protein
MCDRFIRYLFFIIIISRRKLARDFACLIHHRAAVSAGIGVRFPAQFRDISDHIAEAPGVRRVRSDVARVTKCRAAFESGIHLHSGKEGLRGIRE